MPQPLATLDRTYTGPKPPVSVVILTLNEQTNLSACLASCAWSNDVHVLDSGSSDATQAIASAARVADSAPVGWHVNRFTSFGAQRNWAIDHIPLKHDWVFHLDADERFTAPLVAELAALIARAPSEAGFYVANQMILLNTWIKHASGYPAYQMRFFHRHRMRFTDHGHGQRELTSGALGTLTHPYVHLNFSKGLCDWFERHNRYSTAEVEQILSDHSTASSFSSDWLAGGIARRRALKRLFARLPFRPTIRWWHTVLIQRALLDGRAGLLYADMLSVYERMIALKLREKRAAHPGR